MPHVCCCRIIPLYLEERGQTPGAAYANANVAMSTMIRSRRAGLSSSMAGGAGIVGGITSNSEPLQAANIHSAKKEPNFSVISADYSFNEDGKPGFPKLDTDQEVNESKDANAIQAYGTAKDVYLFYRDQFHRLSIDNRNMDINSTVHYGYRYNNAFWTKGHMVYGDGDGSLFGNFTACPDVIAHELTHGVVENTVAFEYLSQSGALNESIADVFGSLFKQFHLKQSATEADWLIGANLIKPLKLRKYALRSLKNPGTAYVNHPQLGTDPQPNHMSEYRRMPETEKGDWGGVHVNSGIPNHAFYLVAQEIGGNAYDHPGQIWYDTLVRNQSKLTPNANFEEFARATITTADALFGEASPEKAAVYKAWVAVGVLEESVSRTMSGTAETINTTDTSEVQKSNESSGVSQEPESKPPEWTSKTEIGSQARASTIEKEDAGHHGDEFKSNPSESQSYFNLDEHNRANDPSSVFESARSEASSQPQQASAHSIVPLYMQQQILSAAKRASSDAPDDSQKELDASAASSTIHADRTFRDRRDQRSDSTE